MRASSVFSMSVAGALAVSACDGPSFLQLTTSPLSVLEVSLVPAADSLLPGYPLPVAIVVRNPSGTSIPFFAGACDVGFGVARPDGTVIGDERSCLEGGVDGAVPLGRRGGRGLGPHDSAVIERWWTGTDGPAWDEVPAIALPPGTYRLRPYLGQDNRKVKEGEAVSVAVIPWTVARFANTDPALPLLDFTIGDRRPASKVAPGFNTPLRLVPVGRHVVRIRPWEDTTTLGSAEVTFREGVTHTVAVRVGVNGPEPYDVTDAVTTATPGEGLLRVVQLAPNAPPLDVYVIRPDDPAPVPVMTPFPYAETSPYLSSPAGEWTIIVTTAGGADTLVRTAAMPINGGQVRTLILTDDGKGGVFGILMDP